MAERHHRESDFRRYGKQHYCPLDGNAEYLRSIDSTDNPLVLKTALSHYSIVKLSNSMPRFPGYRYKRSLGMDAEKLASYLESSQRRNVIIAATMGYTTTGTSDDIRVLDNIVRKLRQRGVNLFVVIDAAINGLCHPFLSKQPLRLSEVSVDCLSMDFHKTGFAPYGASVLLWRDGLSDYVATAVPYCKGLKTLHCFRPDQVFRQAFAGQSLSSWKRGASKHLSALQDLRDLCAQQLT